MSEMTATKIRKSTTRRASKPTAEAPEVEWEKALETALTVPGSVGTVYSRFHDYSYLNCILFMMQGLHEPVASYGRWQELGRQVRKGESGKYVNRPIHVKKREKDANGNDQFFLKFKMVKGAFGLSQTDGPELPPFEIPEWDLDRALATLMIHRMPWLSTDGNAQGYSIGRSFALNPVAVHPQKTTLHEIAHIVLGHTGDDQRADYVQHRGLKEFEAEAVAHLVLRELDALSDAEATVSRGYIQSWLGGEHPGDQAIRRVFKAVNEILNAGRESTDAATGVAA